MDFNNQLKRIRESNGLTQEQLSKILNVSRQSISSWEVGRNFPDLEMIVIISKEFNISLDQLIMGDKNMEKKLIEDGIKTKKARMNIISGILFLIGGSLFLISSFTKSTVLPNGMLYEPYFFLIPLGYLFLFTSIIFLIVSFILKRKKRAM
ncbi:helix-turn-helix domain-containing protein [Lactococcus lactis]|uniref:helix-turn-helix domain-containing protein n=1 Tax=Lactococcus lactis TaxID=1358 RepID=UPI000BF3EAD1|nr:helix-turn-helix domain-containing protein [Lactococcus lactis]PFG84579.1 transcriptional regulator [Lactococcus lactis]UCS90836.1 helix-turn-helix domain-containing protein [Lactococcus lactis]